MINRRKPQFHRLPIPLQDWRLTAREMGGWLVPTWVHRLQVSMAERDEAMIEAMVIQRLKDRFKNV